MRNRWFFENRESYDDTERARRWILRQPATIELMRRYIELADEHDEDAAAEEYRDAHPHLSAVQRFLERRTKT
jgi:hypothetical protein